jgi:ABC-2 type transport system ATP-binding protein
MTATATDTAIHTEGLTKSYGNLQALDGMTLRVPRGSVYGFLGRNGAGKTTTIRLLLGLARPTAGSAHVLGWESGRQQLEILERTAFVPERKVLYDHMTPQELVHFTSGFYPRWSHEAVRKYAPILDIPMKQKFGKLSHGNRTKVCILLALGQNADLLILDEPSIGLDPVMIDDVLRVLMDQQAEEGRTVFFSSHQLSEVEQIAEWIGILDHGKLLFEGRLEDIRSQYRVVVAGGNGLPSLSSASAFDSPATTLPQVLSASRSGAFTRYVVCNGAEAFAAGLRQQGAVSVEVFPLNLREFFLEIVRKEELCTTGESGEKTEYASSRS